jgi:hypothetical protein
MSTSRTRTAQSNSRSRPGLGRRATSQRSAPYLPNGPADLIFPSGVVGEEAADLLHDFVHPSHHHSPDATLFEGEEEDNEEPEDEVDARERARMAERPWWRRPSPVWYMSLVDPRPFIPLTNYQVFVSGPTLDHRDGSHHGPSCGNFDYAGL